MTEIDPKLSRLYRAASSEGPPAALDTAILAAARKQLAKPERRGRAQGGERASPWSRWMVPASAIATLVLGVSIALLVEREHLETSGNTAIRQTPSLQQSPLPARVPESAEVKAADSAAPGVAAKKEAPATAAPARAPVLAAPVQAPAAILPAPAPVPRPTEPTAPTAEAFPGESRAKASASGTARESNAAGDAAIGRLEAAAPAAPAVAAKPAPLRTIQRSPEAWLDEISRLKREGREQEAAQQFAEFRKAYPAHAVPETLRGLEKSPF